MGRHFGPVKPSTVVMAEMVPFVHEVHLIYDRHRIREIVLGMIWITESVLDPCGNCIDEIHAEKRNQDEHGPNSPIVNKDNREIRIVAGHSPEHALSILFVMSRPKVGVGSYSQYRPNVTREVPQEIESARSIVAHVAASVVGSAVLSVVQAHMSRPTQFRSVAIQIPEEELKVAAEDLIVFVRKVAVAPVRLQVAGAEHPDKTLEL